MHRNHGAGVGCSGGTMPVLTTKRNEVKSLTPGTSLSGEIDCLRDRADYGLPALCRKSWTSVGYVRLEEHGRSGFARAFQPALFVSAFPVPFVRAYVFHSPLPPSFFRPCRPRAGLRRLRVGTNRPQPQASRPVVGASEPLAGTKRLPLGARQPHFGAKLPPLGPNKPFLGARKLFPGP